MTQVDFADVLASINLRKTLAQERCVRNKKTLLKAMRRLGIQKIEVSYSGVGDSGAIDEVSGIGADGVIVDIVSAGSIALIRTVSNFENGSWSERSVRKRMPFHEACEEYVCDWLEANHMGWENNDGADGEVVIDLAESKVTFTHNSHYIATETSEEVL
jgi:hypothetical protein